MALDFHLLLIIPARSTDANRVGFNLRNHMEELAHKLRVAVAALVELDEEFHVQVVAESGELLLDLLEREQGFFVNIEGVYDSIQCAALICTIEMLRFA